MAKVGVVYFHIFHPLSWPQVARAFLVAGTMPAFTAFCLCFVCREVYIFRNT